MNILFFLKPKSELAYIKDYHTLRQALEIMEYHKYSSVSIIDKDGKYVGTITEGDLLWALKNMCNMDMRQAEVHRIMEISHRRHNLAVPVTANMHDLIERAGSQNFIPVVDDKDTFIGIITRSAIVKYCHQLLFPED